MADPLSLLLAEAKDEGDSGLFKSAPTTISAPTTTQAEPVPTIAELGAPDIKMFDASKITLKTKKKLSKNLDPDAPPPAQLPHASGLGLGVEVLKNKTEHGHTSTTDDNDNDTLFGLSAPLYSPDNIPGDLFKESNVATKKEEIDTDDLLSSIKSGSKVSSTLNARRSNEDISDLKIAASLVTKEADEDEESLFGRSNIERIKQQTADTEASSSVDLEVNDDLGALETKAQTSQNNDDLEKLSSLLQSSDIKKRADDESGAGSTADGAEEGFDFASYISSQGGDGGGGGGLFG
ncbi:hypothetical protein TrST_g11066 [Triparma strigata]|uniref:Uncharacterized protein n=1 Tax=Triparma strigata TaxID=1606541 RepID=A0A9W7B930_9STRA|nr:hypothetical protein TrST_g11066 [Triparma strigata]